MSDEAIITSDFIVVGAGSSGSVITRRLLDAGFGVHVIEAGAADLSPDIQSPHMWPALLGSPQDWNFMTTPQPRAKDRSLCWPRGNVLGGSSSVNAMIYIRGIVAITTVGPNRVVPVGISIACCPCS